MKQFIDLARHVIAMKGDAHLDKHPEWHEIVKDAETVIYNHSKDRLDYAAQRKTYALVHICDGCVVDVSTNDKDICVLIADEDDNADEPVILAEYSSRSRSNLVLELNPVNIFKADDRDNLTEQTIKKTFRKKITSVLKKLKWADNNYINPPLPVGTTLKFFSDDYQKELIGTIESSQLAQDKAGSSAWYEIIAEQTIKSSNRHCIGHADITEVLKLG